MPNYTPVIGIEIHVELKTKTKMFCRCSAEYFGAEPNTHTCPVCLGLPGALPNMNEQAIQDCMKIGLSLGCSVTTDNMFERKNYFYPDLPKGFQISQLRWPLCVEGSIEIDSEDGPKRIRINRVHQEEDTGKLMHGGGGTGEGGTFIDYNRSGVPLVEIVTEPDFDSAEQVRDYAKKLQQLFRYLGVSNADMERGDMRLEANVSVRPEGQNELPNYRVELKNINSFRFMVAAIEYEIKRQIEALEAGETLVQETRGWNEDKKQTFLQRRKEEANDYRYFPEPDLPALQIDEVQVDRIKETLPELPWQAVSRLTEKLGITRRDALILTEEQVTLEYFEAAVLEAVSHQIKAQEVANIIVNKKVDIASVTPQQLVEQLLAQKSSVISDEGQIGQWVDEVISENPQLVETYKSGKVTVIGALIGNVMRKAGGKADAGVVKSLIESKLS
jgi:aspartyl-tRNA(Asn)/glutamyl-tRNA(Gln) amidotransferase subunit B